MIVLIAAYSVPTRIIGDKGGIPWYIPDDFKRFKALTMGATLVMGRKTYESIGRPLPGRTTIILSRTQLHISADREGGAFATSARSLDEALSLANQLRAIEQSMNDLTFICGGAEVYRAALEADVVDRLELTEVRWPYKGDTFLPEFDLARWRRGVTEERVLLPDERRPDLKVPPGGLEFAFVSYERAR